MSSSLDQLRQTGTIIVADSGDFETIYHYKPQDATTNPSLIFAAASKPRYARLIDIAIEAAIAKGGSLDDQVDAAFDQLLVEFGKEILKVVPGRVSTEVDPRLSFDTEGTKRKARELIGLYESIGIKRDRILIKIASTREGIRAARDLENEGIHCNLTLLFGFAQAVACAEAGVTIISPFVGRIYDWYVGRGYKVEEDPGIQTVKKIFTYYKQHGYKTSIMCASLRGVNKVKSLAGIDALTMPPTLLEELQNSTDPVTKKLDAAAAKQEDLISKLSYIDDEQEFTRALLEDRCAFDNLHEGIRKFSEDVNSLRKLLEEKIWLATTNNEADSGAGSALGTQMETQTQVRAQL